MGTFCPRKKKAADANSNYLSKPNKKKILAILKNQMQSTELLKKLQTIYMTALKT